jgi:hypothetical protein
VALLLCELPFLKIEANLVFCPGSFDC